MLPNQYDQLTIRDYLLGRLEEERRPDFEKQFLIDDELFEELTVAEDDLVDDYLSGDLDKASALLFETHFLCTPERQEKLHFAGAFRKYNAEHAAHIPNRVAKPPHLFFTRKQLFFATPWRIAAFAALTVIAIFGVWRIYFHQSDVDKGLIALNSAYRDQRPLEARITRFDYAPYVTTRGSQAERVNSRELEIADRYLLDAAHDQPSAGSYHALGRVYLARKDFDKAGSQFEEALKTDPNNAQICADLGATFLEKGRAERAGHQDKSAFYFAQSLDQLNRALELNAGLAEALFNRALLYQEMMLPRQAQEDWKKYLEKDPSSPWASEARQRLNLISLKSAAPATPAQLLTSFITAFETGDDEQAWRYLSSDKEMISGKYIPQQIVRAYLDESSAASAERAGQLLQSLVYAGKLELERAHDPYTAHLAAFYLRSTKRERALLREAQQSVAAGYGLCAKSKFDDALEAFTKARKLFETTRDEWESKLVDYWLAYCLNQEDKIKESSILLKSLVAYCEQNNYKWLLGHANCWLGINYSELGDPSTSIRYYNRALAIVAEIDDNYNHQKVLTQLANQYDQLGQPELALSYNWQSLLLADGTYPGARQLWRNYLYITRTLIAMKLYAAAEAYCNEMLYVARNEVKEDDVIQYSYNYLGQLLGGVGRYEEAMELTSKSIALAESLQGKSAARKQAAYSMLQLAHIARSAGHYAQALEDYTNAIHTFDQMELGAYKYDALKGHLLCQVALNNDKEIEAELPIVLRQFDDYRLKIRDEQNLNTFFDREHDVYDLAIDHAYLKGDISRAFTYAEDSRARSLLETLGNKDRAVESHHQRSSQVAQPLGLAELQALIPPKMQVIEYAVLNDKTLIWLITRNSIVSAKSNISESELRNKILTYVAAISKTSTAAGGDLKPLATELYDTLIGPIAPQLDRQKVVCIIPDKAISLVPFAALVSSRSGQYLISEFSLINSPSLNIFISCSEAARTKANTEKESLLAIGNPLFKPEDFPGLPDLPDAARETQGIANFYSSRKLIGPDATRQRILAEIPNADVIHFAGHYLANDRDPMLSRFVLAAGFPGAEPEDGSITAAELIAQGLPRAKLVVLSACETGAGRYYNGEGLISLSRAFLGTGTPLVVGSQWPVDSAATAELMLKFHRYRSREGGLSTVDALRKAQIEMLTEPNGRFRAPYYWAAFLTMGGSADF